MFHILGRSGLAQKEVTIQDPLNLEGEGGRFGLSKLGCMPSYGH